MSLTVELDEQTAAVVQKLAANEKRSASEVIHDALAVYAAAGATAAQRGWQVSQRSNGHVHERR